MFYRKILVLILSILFVCFFFVRSGESIIEEVEIREYEGEDLSSIEDFRENSILGPQYIDIKNYSLIVEGLVENDLNLGYEEVLSNFESIKKIVTLHCVEGWSVRILWEGFFLEDLFKLAKVDPEASVVIFHAIDGYSTSLSLDYIVNNKIIVAYKMNNITLPPNRGFPFELVAESKYGYKWIKWITKIELSNDEQYRGYWESRGYSNNAEISGSSGQPPIPTFTPIPTPNPSSNPTPSPSEEPTNSPTPTFQPSSTPNPTPISDNTSLPAEYFGAGAAIIVIVGILLFILRRK